MSEPHAAAAEVAGHKPYVPAEESPAELTVRAVLLGSLLGIVFAASSVYLALKVGLTVSASIPIAVLSITIFRAFGRATILENNIVQTAGSAGESIAAGIAFTLPALLLMGYELEPWRVLAVALLGGLLGVLMMIPLRHGLIVKEHGRLPYPEGTACADVLIVGEKGGMDARTVFTGFGVGVVYKLLASGLKVWNEAPERLLRWYRGGSVGAEVSPELLGVGYIIGPKISATMLAGGVLGYLVLMPAIALFGGELTRPLYPETHHLIRDMGPNALRKAYVLYIGAGAVATGGIVSLLRSLPTIVGAFRAGWKTFRDSRAGASSGEAVPRTARDLPLTVVVLGSLGLVLAMWLLPALQLNLVSAVLIVLFGFFFVTVSSRITGEIGSSSNPISGMTVATLLITCLLFLAAGWTGSGYRAMALLTGAIVCVAASNGGTTSQDLKTGYLVGATPRRQQLALLAGVVSSAMVIGYTVIMLNRAYTTVAPQDYGEARVTVVTSQTERAPDGRDYRVGFQRESGQAIPSGRYLVEPDGRVRFVVDPGIGGTVTTDANGRRVTKLVAPKAQLFALIIDGILTRRLPWSLVLLGVFLALMMELCGVASLPFAVGVYLPISTSVPIFCGGLVRWLVDRRRKGDDGESSPGTLLSSGYIAGGAIAGLVLAAVQGAGAAERIDLSQRVSVLVGGRENVLDLWALGWFAALAALVYVVGTRRAPAAG
ncbi:MAG: oligopeptide transporter, OPT family [Deltaproteobacteria bacterium]|nr:oligopeptide transporter, OPT family [Deltaproteobacteria bacterium]